MEQDEREDDVTCSPNGTLENQLKVEVRPILALSLCELHLYQPKIGGICHIFLFGFKCITATMIRKWQLTGNALCLSDKRRIQSTLFAPRPFILRRYLLNGQKKLYILYNFVDKYYSFCAINLLFAQFMNCTVNSKQICCLQYTFYKVPKTATFV